MRYNYKITDIDALEAAYPHAIIPERVVIEKKLNRAEFGKIWRAALILGQPVPGVELVQDDGAVESATKAVDDANALVDIPSHLQKTVKL
jgi:hypothetical protein